MSSSMFDLMIFFAMGGVTALAGVFAGSVITHSAQVKKSPINIPFIKPKPVNSRPPPKPVKDKRFK